MLDGAIATRMLQITLIIGVRVNKLSIHRMLIILCAKIIVQIVLHIKKTLNKKMILWCKN